MVIECAADAGSLMADSESVTLINGKATISATVKDAPYIPSGYTNAYVLTKGEGLVIQALGGTPSFEVMEAGNYTIHSIVFNSETLDTGIVVPGQTTGFDVYGLIIAGGGSICASLDVTGAPVIVTEDTVCNAFSGSMYSQSPINCLSNGLTMLSAKFKAAPSIPAGYQQLFVLTEAFSLRILNVSSMPQFEVSHEGFYRIHSLIYNPNTLDLSVVVPGQTTGFDVVNLIAKNDICASLDVSGAVNLVIGSKWFCYFFNRYFKNGSSGKSATTAKGANDTALEALVNNFDSYQTFKESFIASNGKIKLYPNPVINTLKVDMEVFDDEVMDYVVLDINGRKVLSGSTKNLQYGIQTVDTSILNAGMYIVQFNSAYRTVTEKIIVRK
ncbi:T9SS type A sorting domain-containing protein [Mariniflexile aquimaris]|uniref:T9SS type A sorting domain-containing protein n=1 Tax=Mariniflexile aquimaris TaxID=881009 RepID=A0ABW3BWB3_9FLAO